MLMIMDADELAYQAALDHVETDELKAHRAGVPTAAETMATASGRRIGRQDSNWFARLEATIR